MLLKEKEKAQDGLLGGGRIFGDSLGTFGYCMFGEFTGKDKSDRSLNLTGRNGRLFIIGSEL